MNVGDVLAARHLALQRSASRCDCECERVNEGTLFMMVRLVRSTYRNILN